MILRITLEYDTDGQSISQEMDDWIAGNVSFQDIWSLYANETEPDCKVWFEEVAATE